MLKSAVFILIYLGFANAAFAADREDWKVAQNALTSLKLRENSGQFTVIVGQSDKLVIQYDVVPHGGVLYVCGNYRITGHTYRAESRKTVKSDVAVYLNDTELFRSLAFFNRVSSKKNLLASAANCRSAGVPVPTGPNHTMSIKLLKTKFRN